MIFFSFLLVLLTSISAPAHAYIGPGIAIALLGYVSWPIAVLIGLFSFLIYYPIRYLYRKYLKESAEKHFPFIKKLYMPDMTKWFKRKKPSDSAK